MSTEEKDKQMSPAKEDPLNPDLPLVETPQTPKEKTKQTKPRQKSTVPKRNPFEKTIDDSILLIDKILNEEVPLPLIIQYLF